MRAKPGDILVIKGHRVGEPERHGRITEVKSDDGSPPYLVEWDDGHVAWIYPGSDAVVEKPAKTK